VRIRSVVVHGAAHDDIRQAVGFYLAEGSSRAAVSFIDALEDGLQQIARHPGARSPRYERELNIPGLRFRLVSGFPHLVSYRAEGDRVHLWRVLHQERDIPEYLRPLA
jgi:toxin ParE1/3/4